jgi:hypothetical protein
MRAPIVFLPLVLLPLAGCDPSGRCGPSEVCVFEDNSMRGDVQRFTADADGYSPGDEGSSVVNNTDDWVVFFVDPDHLGQAVCVGPQAFVDNLESYEYGVFGHTFGDALSSHDLVAGRPRPASRGGPCNHEITGDSIVGGGGWDRPEPAPAC